MKKRHVFFKERSDFDNHRRTVVSEMWSDAMLSRVRLREKYPYLLKSPVVTTNGVFDLFHRGHLDLIRDCRSYGGSVVVGVNSYASALQLKKSHILLNHEGDRALMLINLEYVDMVILFDEPDPRGWLEIIRPDFHLKGVEYKDNLIEFDTVEKYGGVVQFVELSEGCSTTNYIERIQNQILENAVEKVVHNEYDKQNNHPR